MKEIRNITLIGSGNVAEFFGRQFLANGLNIVELVSRNAEKGKALADLLQTKYSEAYQTKEISDLVLIAVNDDSIAEVAEKLPYQKGLVCHTAGAVSIDVLKRFERRGILYPLQSLREWRNKEEVPLLIETALKEDETALIKLVSDCGFTSEAADSEKRMYYHLAAVFANNFSNAMLAVSEKISRQHGLNHRILQPLIRKTMENALNFTAEQSQTGPAIREDIKTMQKHLSLLENDQMLNLVYNTISELIQKSRPGK